MKTIFIIGAGQLGSRHLQALKAVNIPLSISVIDPNESSLQTAKERFEAMPAANAPTHQIAFSQSIPTSGTAVDLVIVATNANVRRKVVEEVLAKNTVRLFILEKLLFQKKDDYAVVESLLQKTGAKAWVNCSMRTMPFYANLRAATGGGKLDVTVTGSQYGLITNTIHYLDYVAYLTNCNEFSLDTTGLEPQLIASKRPGFSELNGVLRAIFSDGSTGNFRCYAAGEAPTVITVASETYRCISRESEGRAWIAKAAEGWKWQEVDATIPYQSTMTTNVVEQLLTTGTCPLTPYEVSAKIHLQMLEALRQFITDRLGTSVNTYPFT